jgi:hypothetical protein
MIMVYAHTKLPRMQLSGYTKISESKTVDQLRVSYNFRASDTPWETKRTGEGNIDFSKLAAVMYQAVIMSASMEISKRICIVRGSH